MQIKYFDAHCHIQFDQFNEDQEELIERMRVEGVAGVVVGVDLASSKEATELATEHEHLYASIGLHPNRVNDERYDISSYRALARHPKVVAIGECGLDYFRLPSVALAKEGTDESKAYSAEATKAAQKEVLQQHIALAAELDKPLIIHSRPTKGTQDAYQDLIGILKEAKAQYPNLRGDIHFFVGGIAEAEALIALGFTISFTAVITFARDYDEVIKSVSLTSILSETDSPYVPPTNRTRGSRNDPLAVVDVVAKIASIRGEPLEPVRATLVTNAERLFRLENV